jgi:hypothetical protein
LTVEEDAKLTNAVANTSKKNWGKEFKTDWVKIATLVPGRTRRQCHCRWKDALDPNIDRIPPGRTGKWKEDEDSKLKDAVQTHAGKNWEKVATLVPGRTKEQCSSRWHQVLAPNIDKAYERTGKWAEDEDCKLRDAVQTYGDKDWGPIAALVPGRTNIQCNHRWRNVLHCSIDRVNGRTGKWKEDEDSKLKDAVQRHGGKHWDAIAALIPGRTKRQCQSRWQILQRTPEQQ